MLLRLTRETVTRSEIPGDWDGRLARDGDGVLLTGDDTGEDLVYLYVSRSELVASRDIAELLVALKKEGKSLDLHAPEGVSHFLHDSIVPLPRTIFRDIYALTVGDRARVRPEGGGLSVGFTTEFPYFAHLSREDQKPDQARFLELLGDSIERRLRKYQSGVLFLSAGKDSTALAVALAERGRKDVPCVTYARDGDDEHLHAQDTCRKLGLKHAAITFESQASTARDTLERFFTETPLPSGDLAQISTALLANATAAPGRAVIVGSGNDISFGTLLYPRERQVTPFCLGRTSLADPLKRLLPPGSPWNYVLRDPVEILWPELLVRYCDTSKFLPGAVNTSRAWRKIRREYAGMDIVDFRALWRGRNFEISTEVRKIRLAAQAFGVGAILPYLDKGVIDFYFNLPEEERYDRKHWITKRFVREVLRSRIGYDDSKIGKRAFLLDGANFVKRMRSMILDEVYGCRLFDKEGLRFLERSIERADANRYAWHHVVGLFQFAGWYNHSKYLR